MAADPIPTWRPSPEAAWTWAEDDTAVVMPMASGLPLRLSPTGSLVWEVLLRDRSPEQDIAQPPLEPLPQDELVAQVAEACDVSPDVVAADVLAFLALLEERGVALRSLPRPA